MEMQGLTVVVTGGASGIGKATALLLAREGARVFVGDIDEAGGGAVAAQAAGEGLALEFLPLDLAQSSAIGEFAAAVHAKVERVDGLVNAAGWDRIQPFLENPPEMWDQLIQINLLGAVRLTRALLPPMVEARQGKIVNISSDAGRVGSMGETVYAAAKGGLIAFTKSLAREMARYRINVNCVCPGPTDTPLFSGPAGTHARGADPGDPVSPDRPAGRDRRGGDVLSGPPHGLHYRTSVERQRRLDDGRLSCRLSSSKGIERCGDIVWTSLNRRCADRGCRHRFRRNRAGETAAAERARKRAVRQLVCTNPSFRAKRIAQECGPLQGSQFYDSCVASFQCGGGAPSAGIGARRRLPKWSAERGLTGQRRRDDGKSSPWLCEKARTSRRSAARNAAGARDLRRHRYRRQHQRHPLRGNRARAGALFPGKGRAARPDAPDRPQDLLPIQGRLLVLDDRDRGCRRQEAGGERRLGLPRPV